MSLKNNPMTRMRIKAQARAMVAGMRGNFPMFVDTSNEGFHWLRFIHPDPEPVDLDPISALALSVVKWGEIAHRLKKSPKYFEPGGSPSCGLCILYKTTNPQQECSGCPIYLETGDTHCLEFEELNVYYNLSEYALPEKILAAKQVRDKLFSMLMEAVYEEECNRRSDIKHNADISHGEDIDHDLICGCLEE